MLTPLFYCLDNMFLYAPQKIWRWQFIFFTNVCMCTYEHAFLQLPWHTCWTRSL